MNIELLIIILFLASTALIACIAYLVGIVRRQFQAIKAFQFRAKTPVLKSTAQPPAYTALLADDHKPPAYSGTKEHSAVNLAPTEPEPEFFDAIEPGESLDAQETEQTIALISGSVAPLAASESEPEFFDAIEPGESLDAQETEQAKAPSNERGALLAAIKARKTLVTVDQTKAPSSEEVVSQPITTLDPQWAAVLEKISKANPSTKVDPEGGADWSEGEDSDVPEDTHTPPAELEDSGNAGSTSEESRPASPVLPEEEKLLLPEEEKLQAAAKKVALENAQRDAGIALKLKLKKRNRAVYGSSSESSSDGWSLSDNSGDEGHGGGKSRKKHFRSKAKLDSLHSKNDKTPNQQPN